MGPHELDLGSLTEALQREVDGLPPAIDGVFRVEGSPRHLEADTETTILRATKELLLNVTTHSGARAVEVTLSFLGDVVALDVRDDGTGIERGKVRDRGALTGGRDAGHGEIRRAVGPGAAALVPVADRMLRFPLS